MIAPPLHDVGAETRIGRGLFAAAEIFFADRIKSQPGRSTGDRATALRGGVPASSRNDSFEAVVLPHLEAAHNLARWLTRDAAAAEDVVQEAMLRALTYFPSFRGVNPRAWLLQIVRNTAYGSLKLDRGAQLVPLAGADEADGAGLEVVSPDDDPETSLIRSRDRCRVRALIEALPVELRETLVLRELEEFSYKEIAEVTRVPLGTVMSRLWRARQSLVAAAAEQERAR
jgi:RNA polymerase sigma-70 factor (ECF subfamily)